MSDRDSIALKLVAQQQTPNPWDVPFTPEQRQAMTPDERMMEEIFERQRLGLPMDGSVPGRMDLPPPVPLEQHAPVTIEQTDLPDLPPRLPPEEVPMS